MQFNLVASWQKRFLVVLLAGFMYYSFHCGILFVNRALLQLNPANDSG